MEEKQDKTGSNGDRPVSGMTQEQFDKVVENFRKLDRRSGVETCPGRFACRFRDPEGRACALGCLMGDETAAFANGRWDYRCASHELGIDVSFASSIMALHDEPDRWGPNGFLAWDELRDLASKYGLEVRIDRPQTRPG